MSSANYQMHGGTAVITLDNPPVNGLGYDLRCGIVAGIDRATADPAVKAVILIGSDRAFSGGADIREFGSPKSYAEPNLLTVIRVVEACPKPVVAAIGGVCMGGGLELALGAHFRVAGPFPAPFKCIDAVQAAVNMCIGGGQGAAGLFEVV